MNPYGYTKEVMVGFEEAIKRSKKELAKEGFGVLTEINVKETLKKKLGVDYEEYKILGACNPPLAYKALRAEREIGLMLPCNVIVYRHKGRTFVSAIKPTKTIASLGNPKLKWIAESVEKKLRSVVDRI
ncbi:MAG: DUF302 domain-containing protein [Candidatus Aenigmarchaeota archaeon]|nr:DUF302 domain-containing protein [Candidatus Aenigmarchaeota archaeon]